MVLFSLYLQNRASDFDDFCTDVRDSCPEWFDGAEFIFDVFLTQKPPRGISTHKIVETPYDSDFIKVVGFGWKIAV